jgi:nitrite reductase (cytochrome c-552)
MPYRREGAVKVTDHFIASPLLNINASCQTCHHISEDKLRARVDLIQQRTATQLKEAEGAILALMDDIVAASKEFDKERAKGPSVPNDVYKAKVDKVLAAARQAHRRASMRWDFISSENSTGFHSPQEAARVLGAATQLARVGQLSLVNDLATVGIHIRPTAGYGLVPPAGSPIEPRHAPVGDPPSQALLDLDLKVEAMMTPLEVAGESTAK